MCGFCTLAKAAGHRKKWSRKMKHFAGIAKMRMGKQHRQVSTCSIYKEAELKKGKDTFVPKEI